MPWGTCKLRWTDLVQEYFTHVTKAYETLSDDQKRAIYDEESVTDEEFFTINFTLERPFPIHIRLNLFNTFL